MCENKKPTEYNGILCIYKPADFTSFDVIAKLRGIVKFRKLGHGGTLDPMATGVLPIFFGNATKTIDIIGNKDNLNDKEYIATIKFGEETDTLDRTGKITNQSRPDFSKEDLDREIKNFKGEIEQLPPMYSAVQVGGRRLYDIARSGEIIERKPRKTTIYSLDILSFNREDYILKIKISCSKGTYIRALADDLGKKLGTFAFLDSLERTIAFGFSLKDCLSITEIEDIMKKENGDEILKEKLLKIDKMFENFPKISLTDIQEKMFKNGVKLDIYRINDIIESMKSKLTQNQFKDDISVWNKNKLLGIAKIDFEEGELIIKKLLTKRNDA